MTRVRVSGLMTMAIAVCGAATGVVGEVTSWTDVAQQFVQRRAATTEGVVDYRVYGFQTDVASFDHLAALLTPTHTAPNPLILEEVQDWLEVHLPAEHGAMEGWCTFNGAFWQDKKEISPEDTMFQAMSALTLGGDAKVVRLNETVTTHCDGSTETVIRNRRAVEFKHARLGAHPMRALDLTLFDWQQGIDQGPNPDQTIEWSRDGDIHTISITNGAPGDDIYSGADQSASETLGWAPLRATVQFHGQRQQEQVYAYADDGGDEPARPAVVLQGTIGSDGVVRVDLWLVDSWQSWSDPEWLLLRLPPYYLCHDFRDEPQPPLEIHRPSYLENVPREDWIRVATQRVLDSWDAYEAEVDYDCDGAVSESDVAAAVESLRRVVEH